MRMVVREKSVVVIPRFFLLVFSLMILNSYFVASDVGGVITNVGGYTIHTFNVTGNFTFNVTANKNIELLIVGGGGAGGHSATGNAGGGGAGGLVYNVSYPVVVGSYNVSVGSGGIYIANSRGGNGTNSSFGTIIAVGGGGGGTLGTSGNPGGSGGGSGQQGLIGGTGIAGQGFNGGNNISAGFGGAGGGGANQSGRNTSINNFGEGGFGGNGTNYSISGVSICYAGGGGGSTHSSNTTSTGSLGGCGGGGKGSAVTQGVLGANGTNGLGGGGGGNGENGGASGYGGSGIVIVRYLTPVVLQVNISPSNGSSFFVGNHNYFDVNVSSSGFGGNVSTTAFVYNSTNDLIYTYFGQSNPFLFNVTNLSIGTYKINATVWNYSNYDFSNNVFVNQTGTYLGIRKFNQQGSEFYFNTSTSGHNINTTNDIWFNTSTTNFTFLIWYNDKTTYVTKNFGILGSNFEEIIHLQQNAVGFGLRNSTSGIISSTFTPVYNTTQMATGIFNGTHTLIYQNDTLKDSDLFTIREVQNSASQLFYIGMGSPLSGNTNMTSANLSIYKVAVWNRSLSSSEVASEYSLGANNPTPNTVGLVLQYLLNNTASVYSNSTNVFNVQRDLFGMYKPIQTGIFNGLRANGQTGNSFNGTQYINLTSNVLNTSRITIILFYSPSSFTSGGSNRLIYRRNANTGLLVSLFNGVPHFYIGNGTFLQTLGNNSYPVNINNINFGAFSYDGLNLLNYYNTTIVANLTLNSYLFSSGNFVIGASDVIDNYFNGSIFKVVVWNRSLSASEVASEYALGANSPTNITDGLVLQYLLANSNSIYANDSTVFNTNIALDKQGGFENSSVTNNINIYNLLSGNITNPLGGSNISNRLLNITWTNATFFITNISIINTSIILLNDDLSINRTIATNNTNVFNNYLYDLYNQNLSIGRYWIRLIQKDSNNNTVTTQNRFNLTTNSQVNITAKRINNNVSVSSFIATITDLTSGLVQINSTTSSSILFDVVKERNYSVFIISENYTSFNANMTINETLNQRLFYLTRLNSILINFYDEDTLNLIINQTVYLDLISSIYSNNYSTINGSIFAELLSPTTYQSRYSSENYTERFYSFTIVNDTSQTISLYLKKNTTSILIQVKDVALNPVEGAVVKAQKQVPSLGGIFLTVEICTTDFNGECIMSLTQNDDYYRFIVLVDGNVQLTTTASYIIDDIIQLTLPGQGTNADDSFEYLNIESDVSWVNSSKTFSFDFSDPNNLQSSYCLDIYRDEVLINRTCLVSDLGSIDVSLVFSNNTNGTFKANGLILINDNYLLLDQDIQYFPVVGSVANTGKLGVLLQLMLSLVFIIAVKNNPEFIPIAFGLSLIFGKAGSLTLLSWTTISAIAFACLVISVWLGKNKND